MLLLPHLTISLQSVITVLHPEEIWGQHFQLGVWSTFLNTSKWLLIMFCALLATYF